jgi:hypothetical protein
MTDRKITQLHKGHCRVFRFAKDRIRNFAVATLKKI